MILGKKNFNVKTFASYDEEWLDFVTANRKGGITVEYDAVEGGIANDKVFETVDLYIGGLINKEEALRRLAYEKPNHQICILNQEIIDKYVEYIDSKRIKIDD